MKNASLSPALYSNRQEGGNAKTEANAFSHPVQESDERNDIRSCRSNIIAGDIGHIV